MASVAYLAFLWNGTPRPSPSVSKCPGRTYLQKTKDAPKYCCQCTESFSHHRLVHGASLDAWHATRLYLLSK